MNPGGGVAGTALALGRAAGPPASGQSLAPSGVVTMAAEVTSLTAVNGSAAVAAGLADGRVTVWNGRDSNVIELKPHAARVLAVGSTADGLSVVSVAADSTLVRTRITAGAKGAIQRVDLGSSPVRAAVFSGDATLLATGNAIGAIRIFDALTGALRHELPGHRTELQDLALRTAPPQLASAGADADLRVWDAVSGKPIGFVDSDLSLFAVAFNPADGTLAGGGPDRTVTLYDPAREFAPAGRFELQAPEIVSTIAWSRDGRLLAIGDIDDATLSKGGIRVIDAATRAAVAALDTGGAPAARCVFLAQGSGVVAVIGNELRAWMLDARS